MFRGGGGPYGVASITGGNSKWDDGTAAAPSVSFTNSPTFGMYMSSGSLAFANGGSALAGFFSGAGTASKWTVYGLSLDPGNSDANLSRAATNGVRFSALAPGVTTTSRTELNKAVASISNAVATDVLTVTIPNAAHSASLLVRITCSLGAGGAIGANEATATNTYVVAITRTAGVATVAAISAATGAAAVAVAGAATVTATAAVTAMTGGVGAQQTFTVQATVSRSGGSSDNHTCLVYAQLMNANVTGISIS